MSPMVIGWIVFGCVFGGALLGMFLRTALPEHHLSQDSRDLLKLGTGLIGTMAALVIGLLISSAKTTFDTQSNEVTQMAANVALLDRVLAHYGPETQGTRDLVRRVATAWVDRTWPEDGSAPVPPDTAKGASSPIEAIQDGIRGLVPQNEAQRELRSEALQLAGNMAQARGLFFQQFGSGGIPVPFLAMLVIWLAVIFVSFGLLAPSNPTIVAALLLCALSASGAIYLILEMERPFEGLMKISGTPVRVTLSHLGQ